VNAALCLARGKYHELNNWLMPKIFPGLFDDDETTLFLGIGSVIFDFHPLHSRKIVFGSGYGGYTQLAEFDETWRFYCVRGPRPAHVCNLSADLVAGDTAILMNRHRVELKALAEGELAGVRFIDLGPLTRFYRRSRAARG
jgi:hypothetical protein